VRQCSIWPAEDYRRVQNQVIRNCGRKGRNTNASVGRYEEVRVDAATPDIDVDRLEGGKVCGDIEDHPPS
jgi:hypothetical protein